MKTAKQLRKCATKRLLKSKQFSEIDKKISTAHQKEHTCILIFESLSLLFLEYLNKKGYEVYIPPNTTHPTTVISWKSRIQKQIANNIKKNKKYMRNNDKQYTEYLIKQNNSK